MSLWKRKPTSAEPPPQKPVLHCSFCNKSQLDTPKLIAGPRVYICSECVDICNDILAEGRVVALRTPPAVPSESSQPVCCSLCKMSVPLDFTVGVRDRGLLCRTCADAVQEAVATAGSSPEP
jgi:hypothetical protein